MGIKNLSKIIKEYKIQQNLYSKNNLFKKIGVDTSLFMHKFGYILYNKENPETDLSPRINECFYRQFLKFKRNDIRCIYIFDNVSHVMKSETILKRKEKNVSVIKKDYYSNLQDFFKEKQVPYHVSPVNIEAEHFAAHLNKEGIVDAVLSEDLDTLIFGCKILITGLSPSGDCQVYDTKTVLEKLGLSQEQFVMLGISLGCDYNQSGLKNYGPVKALKYIKSDSFDVNYLKSNIDNYDSIFEQFTHEFKNLNVNEYNVL